MPKLRAPGKSITLRPVRPNIGNAVAYQAQLDALVTAMHKSLVYWLTAAYRNDTPYSVGIAQDASPTNELRKVMIKLGRRWNRNFDNAAKELAVKFADKTNTVTSASMLATLKKAGFTVPLQNSRAVTEAYQAVIGEQVGLIKSIASKHLNDVEQLVMRSVQTGRDLGQLRDDIIERYEVTKKRAAFIARDQNNKATAVMDRARKLELGITKAKWQHSAGGVHPRKSHVDASGKVYDVAKGCLIDGEYIIPGELPNCRCVSLAVIPGFDDED